MLPLVVCADDFGLSPGVNDAIMALIRAQRLSATSCMSNLPGWRSGAEMLCAAVGQADVSVGLHLTLTDHTPLSAGNGITAAGRMLSLPRFLSLALCRALPLKAVREELCAQLDAFEDDWGRPPSHLDGHQHVHLLPGVRECVIDELIRRYPLGQTWVRSCTEHLFAIMQRGVTVPKALFISLLGSKMHTLLAQAGLPANRGFSGLYDFSGKTPFQDRFRRFLCYPGEQPLVQVHPGWVDPVLLASDTLTTQREVEYAYLAGDLFPVDLEAAGYCLSGAPRAASGTTA